MEGSLRQAGAKLRLSVQLVDAITGAHLWAENYERAFSPDAFFELQDDLVPRIVSTVADTQGILPRTMSDILRTRNPSDLSPYEAVLRSFAHFQRVNAEEHAASSAALERAVEVQPGYADAWAMLSLICKEEFTHQLNLRPDPLGRAMAAALRAVEAAPSNHLAFHALAMANYFLGDRPAFRSAAERALELNPMDGFSIAFLGSFIAYDGDWEYGCRLSAKARSLNPHHPGWYWFVPCFDAYRKGDYRLSLEFARKVNMPSLWRTSAIMAAALGQLGEIVSARILLQTLLTRRPNFKAEARKDLAIFWGPDLVEGMIEGLRKAGLEIADSDHMPRLRSKWRTTCRSHSLPSGAALCQPQRGNRSGILFRRPGRGNHQPAGPNFRAQGDCTYVGFCFSRQRGRHPRDRGRARRQPSCKAACAAPATAFA